MRILVTGASGVLGRVSVPLLNQRGHVLATPSSGELNLFDAEQVGAAIDTVGAVLHLASRIPTANQMSAPGAWQDNDRLRDDATALIVRCALAGGTALVVVPTVAFIYPPGPADETTPIGEIPDFLRSALAAEHHIRRFTEAGRRGVVLRLGSLYGPPASARTPSPRYNAHVLSSDAGEAIAASLYCPAGVYNIVDDASPVSHALFTHVTGWRPRPAPPRGD